MFLSNLKIQICLWGFILCLYVETYDNRQTNLVDLFQRAYVLYTWGSSMAYENYIQSQTRYNGSVHFHRHPENQPRPSQARARGFSMKLKGELASSLRGEKPGVRKKEILAGRWKRKSQG